MIFDSNASCFYHVFLTAAALGWIMRRPKRYWPLVLMAGLVGAATVLFSGILRWQWWNSRYHLPLLAALMPVTAVVVGAVWARVRWFNLVIVSVLSGFAAIVVLENRSRPILDSRYLALEGRLSRMLYVHGREWIEPIGGATEAIIKRGSRSVGLRLGFEGPEYPLRSSLLGQGFRGRIDHVLVTGPSGKLDPPPTPDVIVSTGDEPLPAGFSEQCPCQSVFGPLTLYWSRPLCTGRDASMSESRKVPGEHP